MLRGSLLAIVLLLAGCAGVQKIEVPVSASSSASAVPPLSPVPVALVITPELLATSWRGEMFRDPHQVDFGPPVAQRSKALLESFYSNVRITTSREEARGAKLVFVPKIEKIEFTSGVWAGTQAAITMVMSWQIYGAGERPLIEDTVIGVGPGVTCSYFTYKQCTRDGLVKVMEDTFGKTRAKIAAYRGRL